MKKLIAQLLAIALIISLAACGSSDGGAVRPGSSVTLSSLEIKFEKAKAYDDLEFKSYSASPAEGSEFVVCYFKVTNKSDKNFYVNPLYLESYADGVPVADKSIGGELDGYFTFGGHLEPGDNMKSYIEYELTKGWQKLDFTYADGEDVYSFEVTPDDLS